MQPNTSYIICFTPRSGSSLLCEAIINTGMVGQPDEYFGKYEALWKKRWGILTFAEYLPAVIEQCTTPEGIFGIKMVWAQLEDVANKMRQLPAYKGLSVCDSLNAAFPNLHYIWIKRRNKARQAISLLKGIQTGIWRVETDSSPRPMGKPAFSFQLIDLMIYDLEAEEAAWKRYFRKYNIEPLVVMYEDLVASYEETALQILKELDIVTEQVTFAPRLLKQVADEESKQWVQRYCHLRMHSKWYRWISSIDRLVVMCLRTMKLRAAVARIYIKFFC